MHIRKIQIGFVPQLGKHVAVVDVKVDPTRPKNRHSMLLLDVSGSMDPYIDEVSLDSQGYVAELPEDEFVSVIIFSGHGYAKLIAGPTQCNKAGREMVARAIEREVKTLNTTVFSEPLEMALQTVQRLSGSDTVHNAVLFTDGCAVPTKWGVKEEQEKSYRVARALNEIGAVVSVIGYGMYYDDRFITKLMQAAGNVGVYRHISDIENFGPVIREIRDVFLKTYMVNVDLTFAPTKGVAGRVFRTTPQVIAVSDTGRAVVRSLYDGQVTFFVELSDETGGLFVSGKVDDTEYSVNMQVEKLTSEDATSYVRVLGSWAFLNGDREAAAEFLQLTGDLGLSEKAAYSYTTREQREMGDICRRFFVDRKFIGEGLKPTGPSHSILNVLRVLVEDSRNVVYIPKGAYKRSGELTSDPRVIHSPHGRTLKVTGVRSHKSRLNFSVQALKDVKVLPEDGQGEPVDMKIHRTYNIVLDGNLHLPELESSLSEESFKVLQEAGVISAKETYQPARVYTVNLRDLKMISPNWANPATLGLVQLLREEADLKAKQTALNAIRKAKKPDATDDEEDLQGGDIFVEHAKKVEGVVQETYSGPNVEYRLMGYKAQPLPDYSGFSYDDADTEVKKVRQRLIAVRWISRSIIFAMETVGSKVIAWDSGKVTTKGEFPKLEQTATFGGANLKRVTWDETYVCS